MISNTPDIMAGSPEKPTLLSEMWLLPNCSVENPNQWNDWTCTPNLDPKEPVSGGFKGASWQIPINRLNQQMVFDGKIVKELGNCPASYVSWHQFISQWIQRIHILRSEHFTTNGSPLLSWEHLHWTCSWTFAKVQFEVSAKILGINCLHWVNPM